MNADGDGDADEQADADAGDGERPAAKAHAGSRAPSRSSGRSSARSSRASTVRRAEKGITPREMAFVTHYVGGVPAGRAYERAGFKAVGDVADAAAARLMTRVRVLQAIETARAGAFDRAGVSADRVIGGLAAIAFGDVRKLFDAAGRLIRVGELDSKTAAAVASIEVIDDAGGKDREPTVTSRIKLADRIRALELLGRHLSLFEKRFVLAGDPAAPLGGTNVTVNVDVFSRIDELVAGFRPNKFASTFEGAGARMEIAGGSEAGQVGPHEAGGG